jgi:DNA polymerase-3 subunit epsilon
MSFIAGAELVIHNAAFDVAFLDYELGRHAAKVATFILRKVGTQCRVLDTLALARQMHPGQRNNLDALCKRYEIDNAHRELHGALLDARILADVYLAMTGGQVGLALGEAGSGLAAAEAGHVRALVRPTVPLVVVVASAEERGLHDSMLQVIAKASKGRCLWQALDAVPLGGAQTASSA